MCVLCFGMMDAPIIRVHNLTLSTLAACFIAVTVFGMFGRAGVSYTSCLFFYQLLLLLAQLEPLCICASTH